MRRLKPFILAMVVLAVLSSSCGGKSLQTRKIHIFYTANMLGQIEAVKDKQGSSVGGILRVGYLVSLKQKDLNNMLFLDAGNTIGPNPLLSFSQGLDQIKIMNEIGYTAMALGEMEFMYGPEALKRCIEEARFPLLSANVFDKDTGNFFTRSYLVHDTPDGLRVGITGVTDPEIPLAAYGCSNLLINEPFSPLREVVNILRQQKNCDLVIVLSNLTPKENKEIAGFLEDIDIIIGGDVRATLPATVYQSIPQDIDKGVCMFYCTPRATTIGKITLQLEKQATTTITNVSFESFYLGEKFCPQETMTEEVPSLKRFVEELLTSYKEREEMIIGEVKEGESIKLATLVVLLMEKYTNAEFALCDRGLFGWFLQDFVLQGPIREYDIYEGIPYNDKLVLVEMKGDDLLDLIDYCEDQIGTTKELVFSPGFDPDDEKVNGEDIDDDEKYLIAVNSYLADQGAGYTVFEEAKLIEDTSITIRELTLRYIGEKSKKEKKIDLLELERWAKRLHWKYKIELVGELDFFYKNESTASYSNINEFSRSQYYEWVIEPVFQLEGRSTIQKFHFSLAPAYGKGVTFPKDEQPYEEVIANSVNADARYRRYTGSDSYWTIFLELDDMEITPEDNEPRRGSLSTNLGIGHEFSSDLDASIGVGAHKRLFVPGEDYGLYLKSEYQEDSGNRRIDISARIFYILNSVANDVNYPEGKAPRAGDYTIKVEGNLSIPLTGSLSLDLEPLIYYESNIGKWALAVTSSLTLRFIWGLLP